MKVFEVVIYTKDMPFERTVIDNVIKIKENKQYISLQQNNCSYAVFKKQYIKCMAVHYIGKTKGEKK